MGGVKNTKNKRTFFLFEELRDKAPKDEHDAIHIEELRLSIIEMLVKEWSRLKTANNALKRPQNMFKLLT